MNPVKWWRARREPEPSPIPEAVQETRRLAAEVSRVAEQLRRVNDLRESRLR